MTIHGIIANFAFSPIVIILSRIQITPQKTEKIMRPNNRGSDALRSISFTRDYTKHAEGSVLTQFGDTIVLCNASVTDSVPRFLKDARQGWLTAEYSMLPRATNTRTDRESTRGKQGGRTVEIQRLIGRSLRAVIDLTALGERQIKVDCDVIQADGGTRTAAITGGFVALYFACKHLVDQKLIKIWTNRSDRYSVETTLVAR